jgi:hypothetical protein
MLDVLAGVDPTLLTLRWHWVCLGKMEDPKLVALYRVLEGIKDGIFVAPN